VSDAGSVRLERRGPGGQVMWLTFDRPQARNALTWEMYSRLEEALAEVEADRSVRCLVLTGAGGAFVAGTDISQFRAFRNAEDAIAYEERGDRLFTALESLRVPTVAAIQGPCTGAGFGLAACCDLRIGSPSARLGLPIARTLGNCLSMGTYTRFAALLGVARLKEVIFLARLLDAEEARAVGVLNEVAPDEEGFAARVQEVAEELVAKAPLTLWATKEALRRITRQLRPPDGSDIVARVYTSRDFREGIEAFFAKRPADWRGE
jgi:enoyl-CoA hydratase